ncbi:MAG: hypothetical protein U0Q16_19715 [Bryobacteraceae bacterium]
MKKLLWLALPLASAVFGQADGNDISTAVPITLGQVTNDILDERTKPRQIYKISLARGQRVRATVTLQPTASPARIAVTLIEPERRTLSSCNWGCDARGLANDYTEGRGVSWLYQVATGGDYYVGVFTGSAGVNFRLEVTADGTPIVTPLPAQAGCVFGQVDFVEYSLRLVAMGLPDRLSIGGQEICGNCTAKPPLYEPIVREIKDAMRMGVNVEACYDDKGNIFKVKLQR